MFIKTIIFTLLVPGVVAVMIPWLIVGGTEPGTDYLMFLGGLLMCTGIAIYSWCVWDFICFGKGTPAPIDAPKHLVVKGLYHYTRNPMYVGVLLFIFGWLVVYAVPLIFYYGLCVATCFQLFVVFYEEPILKKQFGTEYDVYSASVNRWLPSTWSMLF